MTVRQFFTTRTVILLALTSMVGLSVLSYNSFVKLNSLADLVDHTHEVQRNLEQTYSVLSQSDSEFKSFLLTRDSVYYHRWIENKKIVDSEMSLLKNLTEDNQQQQNRLAMLASLISQRRNLMDSSTQANETQYDYYSAKIEECNNAMEKTIALLIVDEEKLLKHRVDESAEYKSRAPFLLLSLQVVVVIVLLVAFILVTSDLRTKAKLQRELMLNNEELKNQRDFIQGIFDNTVDVIIVLDTKLNIVAFNKRARKLYDPNNEAIGKNLLDRFPQSAGSHALKGINNALKGHHSHIQIVESIIHPNVFFESFFVPLYSGEKISGVIAIHHDISELVKMSSDIRAINDQLQKSNLELEQFAYVTSHDLQEPLRKIRTFSDMAHRGISNPEVVKKNLDKIEKSAERMSVLIADILNYSRLAHPEVQPGIVDLNTVLQQVLHDFELLIQEKGVRIKFENLPTVLGSAQQLTQVFSNIVSNSIKFSRENPEVTITARVTDDHAIISIKDNGIGFEQTYAEQIFRVFQRLHSQHQFAGTGIGLALCKKIIQNHGGSIQATSAPGVGTTITMTLPVFISEEQNELANTHSIPS